MKVTPPPLRGTPLVSLSTYLGGGGSGSQPGAPNQPPAPSGHVPFSTGSNAVAWGSNVAIITSNGSNQVTGPFVNFASGSGISFAVASNTLTITGGSGSGNPAWVIDANAAPYSAISDGATDATAAFQSAINAAYAAAVSEGTYVGIVEAEPGVYSIQGALVTTGNYYAQITLPTRSSSDPKVKLLLRAKHHTGMSGPIDDPNLDMVILHTSLTGQSYSATHGCPTILGGPDVEKTSSFSNIMVHTQGWAVRSGANPSVRGFGFGQILQAIVEDFRADTTEQLGSLTQPTNPTGLSVTMPANNNNAISEYRGQTLVTGWYAGPGIGEHTHAQTLLSFKCHVGINIEGNFYHAASVDQATVELSNWVIGTVDPSSGLVNPSGANGYSIFTIDMLDIEDGDTSWYQPDGHIYDPGNDYYGRVRYMRVLANTGTITGALTVTGGANLHLDELTDQPSGGTTSPLTTKGDLWSYSTLDARFAVGSNGTVPIADSVQTLGLRYSYNAPSGELLISDTPAGSPLVFGDILQNELQDDLLYGDL